MAIAKSYKNYIFCSVKFILNILLVSNNLKQARRLFRNNGFKKSYDNYIILFNIVNWIINNSSRPK